MSKEFLLERVWGYKYDITIHDPMIFTALGRLRTLLGPFKDFLQLTENGYWFTESVEVINHTAFTEIKRATKPELISQLVGQIEQLNFRQLQIMNHLNSSDFIDLQTCLKLFKTSPITASRDLSQLHKRGLITRIGRARATKYIAKN